ncbi:hypothetical protein TcasGA2_TC031993 [Tribolium castaneum]|uniref:Uncharacterized protein n=1 Tax=Tribolium castaneum TaxID=7070 RepID=A0A139WNS5_TRICA|nr:hypothetical protein TcasGA2_TC031993 [Tribolium castaneum]
MLRANNLRIFVIVFTILNIAYNQQLIEKQKEHQKTKRQPGEISKQKCKEYFTYKLRLVLITDPPPRILTRTVNREFVDRKHLGHMVQ